MKTEELQFLRESRLEGETINETRDRLAKEGKFCVPDQKSSEESREEHRLSDLEFNADLAIPRWKIVQPQCRIEGSTNTLPGTIPTTAAKWRGSSPRSLTRSALLCWISRTRHGRYSATPCRPVRLMPEPKPTRNSKACKKTWTRFW